MRRTGLLLVIGLLVAGCGATSRANGSHTAATGDRGRGGIPASLRAEVRPIGRGPRFQPPLGGRVPGACTAPLGQRLEAHIEVFGANRVVLLAAGIGTAAPRRLSLGRIVSARCFGDLVTLDPTGTVYFRPREALTLGDLFSAWGQALTRTRIASFTGGQVAVYLNGRRRRGSPRAVPLTQHAEIVLEVGPHVPPHAHFTFAAMPAATLR